jgi:hypothetical protein
MPDLISNTDVLFGGLVGAALSQGVTSFNNWRSGRKKARAVKGALLAEIEVCADFAKTFMEESPHILAPLYRLPTSAFDAGLRELLGAGAMSERDAQALIRFYSQVETFNRGLEQAADTPVQAPGVVYRRGLTLDQVDSRNRLKAESIRAPNGHLYLSAAVAVTC